MIFLYCTIFYIGLHCLFYLTQGKQILALRTEKGVFLYHFVSFLLLGICTWIVLLKSNEHLCNYIEIAVVGLHGIYSLSFLEIWSLSQGGYSISILRSSPIEISETNDKLLTLESIGNNKVTSRIQSLQKLDLINIYNNLLIVTSKGRLFVMFSAIFIKLTNIQDIG